MVTDPVEIGCRQGFPIKTFIYNLLSSLVIYRLTIPIKAFHTLVISVLNRCPLILDTDIEFTYIIYKLRVDAVHLVDIRKAIATEIHFRSTTICICRMNQRVAYILSQTKILHITEIEDSLPFLSIYQ